MTKEVLITGGAGFIGSNFIQYLLKYSSYQITNIDALTYAGILENTQTFQNNDCYRFIRADIRNRHEMNLVLDRHYDVIINFAAESHVDRSIENAYPFIDTNVVGTLNLLNILLEGKAKMMLQISTDEVYGSLGLNDPPFTEETPISPNNPYAASKASADMLVRAFYQTYQIPLIITRCSNNYGPKQHPEKLIPKTICNALANKPIPIYGDGLYVRNWIFVEDHCRAIHNVLERGTIGEVYNIGGGEEKTNLEIVTFILDDLGKDRQLIRNVDDRKGHDRRYAMNCEKISREIGYKPTTDFENGMKKTIEWYKQTFKR